MFKKKTEALVLIFFFFSVIPNFVCAQEKVNKTFYYPNGNKSSEGTLTNGKPDGYWKNYYETGLLKSEGNRKNFQLDSTWKFYNIYGDLVKTIDYKLDKKTGFIATFSDSCYLILKEPVINDIKHGIERSYYNEPNLIKHFEKPYKEGILDGTVKEYSREGVLITLIIYRHGFIKSKERINRSDKRGKQGIWKEFYSDEKLHREMRYKNDLLNGYYKEYDRDGKLKAAYLYVDGVRQDDKDIIVKLDMRRTFYDTGELQWEGGYTLDNEKQGAHILYNKKGDIERVEVYQAGGILAKGKLNEKGQRTGYWEEYHANTKLKSKGKYKDGIKIGDWSYYFENSQVEQKGKYTKDGKPTGFWIWYYANGNVLREENFRKGLEDGDFIEYDELGTVITKGEYLDGNKEGFWFYELGDYREEGNYVDNRRSGEWKHFYDNKNLLFTGSYLDGYPEGKHRYYYKDGTLKREENYSVGEPEGAWKSYTIEGDLFLTILYKDGREYKLDNKKLKY